MLCIALAQHWCCSAVIFFLQSIWHFKMSLSILLFELFFAPPWWTSYHVMPRKCHIIKKCSFFTLHSRAKKCYFLKYYILLRWQSSDVKVYILIDLDPIKRKWHYTPQSSIYYVLLENNIPPLVVATLQWQMSDCFDVNGNPSFPSTLYSAFECK